MAVFPRTAAQFSELGSNFKNLGGNIAGSFGALKNSVSGGTGKLGGLIDWSAKSTVWAARQPVKFVSWTYKTFPLLASIATIGAGAIVAGNFLRNRAEKRTEREFEAQAASMPMYQPQPAYGLALANTMPWFPPDCAKAWGRARLPATPSGF